MDEDEAALLAELRAISSAGSRFDDDDDGDDGDEGTIDSDRAIRAQPPPQSRPSPRRPELDPVSQRRHEADASELESEQGVDSFSHMSISSLSHQKQGDSSVGASSASGKQPTTAEKKDPPRPAASRHAAGTPPWKRKNRVMQSNDNNDDGVVVPESPPAISHSAALDRFADADEMTMARPYRNSAKDERSGPAEDAELLAALREVSSKSSAADRFASVEEENDSEPPAPERPTSPKPCLQERLQKAKRTIGTPPWKRKNKVTETQVDVVVAAPPPPMQNDVAAKDHPPSEPFPKSTYTGERGGAAEDEELLAELRKISSKSSAADRFADDEENQNNNQSAEQNTTEPPPVTPPAAKPPKEKPTLRSKIDSIPPWKRRGARAARSPSQPDVDIVVAAAPKPAPAAEPTSTDVPPWKQKQNTTTAADNFDVVIAAPEPKMGIKSDIPSTFTGERGGAAEDEELLKMLRDVSAKSGAADRFAGDQAADTGVEPTARQASEINDKPSIEAKRESKKADARPPWKQKRRPQSTSTNDVDVVVAAPPPKYGIKSDIPSTFKGERGGAAEDEELLAELRKISSTSGAADRFANEEEDHTATHSSSVPAHKPPSPAPSRGEVEASKPKQTDSSLPPWKQKRKPQSTSKDVDVVVAAPEPKYGVKSDIPSTFQGERGGAAEDEELLAELRMVSSKSGAADRFADNDDAADSTPAAAHSNTRVASVEDKVQPIDESVGYGIKSDIPSTFQGERGGAAEDEELLAELRKISSKSSADRFTDQEDEAMTAEAPPSKPPPPKKSTKSNDALPPWKRRGNSKPSEPAIEIEVPDQGKAALSGNEETPASPIPRRRSGLPAWKQSPRTSPLVKKEKVLETDQPISVTQPQAFGIKSDAPPSTFSGERGGSAEDAELLALLRGVSMKSGAADRFADEGAAPLDKEIPASPAKPRPQQSQVPAASPSTMQRPQSAVPPTPGTPSADVEEITREGLPEALKSKNWKVRSSAFLFLKGLLTESDDPEMRGNIKGDDILPSLDDQVAGFLEDTNANVLDKAVDFALLYADFCQGAGSADRARSIVTALVKKNGLSGKASTTQLASMLALKLMEVGENGNESAHAVIDALIEHGLSSKKVKVVQASSSLMCQAAIEFGASPLPLASMVSCIPKMMSHSNPKVRESGLALLAEMCRSLGSRSPVQQIIDGMRPAQVSELDSLLSKKPNADPPRRQLRGMQGQNSGSGDALAALQAGSRELEAKRYAARPAVPLMEVLPKTDYAAKLKLAKWSEKVAALDIALSSGGEQPYKLSPPSSSNNYAPLIAEMKKLLAHTHFAVNSKAMAVLSMLAEGVGEKLYPHLRPLLPKLLELSKDKKLTKAVASCADSLFGNVVSFDHILEPDVLPFLVDDKKSKNALARASALDFLGRCVTRRDAAGPRGQLSMPMVGKVGQLAIDKLGDPDVGVRNAGMKVLEALKDNEDDDVRAESQTIIESLKSTNARAYKSLSKGSSTTGSSQIRSVVPKQVDSPTKSVASRPVAAIMEPPPETKKPLAPSPTSRKSNAVGADAPRHPGAASAAGVDEPALAEALAIASTLRLPSWDSPEDDGGILAGLKSSKWIQKQSAIKSIITFVESDLKTFSPNGAETKIAALLQVVKSHTKEFKESNVNIMKTILQLFSAICDYHFSTEKVLAGWIVEDFVSVSLQKISDKKLMDLCKEVLTSVGTVTMPAQVLSKAATTIKTVRAPVAHEEFMKWCRSFCDDFGASSVGPALSEVVVVLLGDIVSSNPKVRRETSSTLTEFYRHLGPKFRALLLSSSTKSTERDEIEKCLETAEFDPSLLTRGPSKQTVASSSEDQSRGAEADFMSLPNYDLLAVLPADCVQKMNSKDGKASWKLRKEAIDAVDDAMTKCTGLVDSSSAKPLVELTRALRDRLSDTQINLKPLAAKAIGKFLGNIDPVAQAKLGKIVYAPLLGAAMNDIKKPMREASLESIGMIIRSPDIEGNAVNRDALEGLVSALVSEINETAVKSIGLSSVLEFLRTLVDDFPNLDEVAASRGESLGERFASVLMECLMSSKAETRSESTSLVKEYAEKGVLGSSTFRKASEKLKPAKQRTVKPLLEKITSLTTGSSEKENQPSSLSRIQSQEEEPAVRPSQATPRAVTGRPTPSFSRSQAQTRSARNEVVERPSPRVLGGKESVGRKPGIAGRDGVDAGTSHPLVSRVPTRVQPRPMVWPEYPEEPLGGFLFGNLKKGWSTILPQTSIMKLFPSTGIKKQDDALEGCELLSSAISLDRSRDKSVVIEQLDFILKWICIVLCSKEATVGLQALLDLVQNLFHFLVGSKHEFNESECIVLIPFIIEKSANAKGRFRESFVEIVGILQGHKLVPAFVLGPVGCVAVIERSSHAKARAVACSLCLECIGAAGLVGIGKKGVVAAAKSLSEEHIPENRNATLDLLEAVLERMNGDLNRFARAVGPSFDAKSRELLEERWRKRDPTQTKPWQGQIPASKPPPARKPGTATAGSHHDPGTPESRATVLDELPALKLRDTAVSAKPVQKAPLLRQDSSSCPTGSRPKSSLLGENLTSSFHGTRETPSLSASSSLHSTTLMNDGLKDSMSERLGTAAVLRQRLLKLKEKTVGQGSFEDEEKTFETAEQELDHILSVLQKVFDTPTPISEFDPEHVEAISASKRLHTALSQHQEGGDAMRETVLARLSEILEFLTRGIGFSLDCAPPSVKEGMSIQLLSVCLAALIALFKDSQLAFLVTQEDLMLLIRETATALLDPRLVLGASQLDDDTCTQMVRAINKTTIAAASGVPRHTSLQALLTIQQQLCLEPPEDGDGDAFNRRMARVITKLFSRVIRHEESMATPFSADAVDMEALVCTMEDTLVACTRAEREPTQLAPDTIEVCRDLVKSLTQSIIKSHGGPTGLLDILDELGIDSDTSDLGKLLRLDDGHAARSHETLPPRPTAGPSIAVLVNSFVNAREETERRKALDALREYRREHGETDLKNHLEQVSPAFRAFLEEQLGALEDTSPERPAAEKPSSMSERLRSLRSRIAGSDLKVTTDSGALTSSNHSAASPLASTSSLSVGLAPSWGNGEAAPAPTSIREAGDQPSALSSESPRRTTGIPSPATALRSSRLSQPSPSKLPTPTSFRERLAASAQQPDSATQPSSHRAAALRARLEAVRHQGK